MTTLYILRKHPPIPRHLGPGHEKFFTIEAVSEYRAELWEAAKQKNKRSNSKWTVAKLTSGE
jgi:hypothetical protein